MGLLDRVYKWIEGWMDSRPPRKATPEETERVLKQRAEYQIQSRADFEKWQKEEESANQIIQNRREGDKKGDGE